MFENSLRGKRRVARAAWLATLATVVIGAGASASGPVVLHVDDDAPAGGDGSTWATAYRHVQDALAQASKPGALIEEIRVAGGVYRPDRSAADPAGTGDRAATFELEVGVVLRGGYAGLEDPDSDTRDVMRYETVLTGDLAGDDDPRVFGEYGENSRHVVTMHAGATIDGVTVTGGNADQPGFGEGGGGISIPNVFDEYEDLLVHDCTIVRNRSAGDGGGLFIASEGRLDVTHTLVLLNEAGGYGAGMSIGYTTGERVITGSTFEGNQAAFGGAVGTPEFARIAFDDCVFVSNHATSGGGAVLYGAFAGVTFADCDLKGNTANDRGGALFSGYEASANLVNCSFRGNEAFEGGAIWNDANLPMELMNCEFTGNVADTRGGGISCVDTNIYVRNSTLVGNVSHEGGAIFNADESYVDTFEVDNSILWYNEAMVGVGHQITLGAGLDYGSTALIRVDVTRSDLEGHVNGIHVNPDVWISNVHGVGVMDLEPEFVGFSMGMTPAEWVYASVRLMLISPAVDAGFNSLIPADVLDIDGDGDVTEPVPLDLDRRERVVDTSGFGFGNVDLGAFEWQPCRADLDGSGAVGFADLGELLASWGMCPGCAADFDGNGKVGFEDLSYLLARWGPCS